MQDVLRDATSALKLSVTVSDIDQVTLDAQQQIAEYEIKDNNQINFYLNDEKDIGSLLKACTASMNILGIDTEKVGLHRIYLDAVRQHKEMINEHK
jgi:peroxiredoxin family protein